MRTFTGLIMEQVILKRTACIHFTHRYKTYLCIYECTIYGVEVSLVREFVEYIVLSIEH